MTIIQKIAIAYAIIANIVGLSVMGIDKRRAICHKWRIPEKTLFLVSILGGSIGTWAGMYLFRHKTLVLCNRNAIYTDCATGFILLFLVKIFSNRDRRDKIYQTEMRYG